MAVAIENEVDVLPEGFSPNRTALSRAYSIVAAIVLLPILLNSQSEDFLLLMLLTRVVAVVWRRALGCAKLIVFITWLDGKSIFQGA